MNALVYYNALAALICSPWSKLRALTVSAGPSVKYTFHSEQSGNRDSCCFIACRIAVNKTHAQRKIRTQSERLESHLFPDLLSTQ